MTLTDELKAQGWCETLHIDKAPNDGIYQTAYFNGLGEIIVQDELLNKKEAIGAICRFDTFRVLTPVAPNTITISVDDAKMITQICPHDYYTSGKLLQPFYEFKLKISKQLEGIKQ